MDYTFMTISLPDPKASSKSRRGSSSASDMTAKTPGTGGKKRAAALKSAKAAVRAQYDGKDPDQDDIRVQAQVDSTSKNEE